MNEKTLQEKLRFYSVINGPFIESDLMDKAADRIDELERQLAEAMKDQARYFYLKNNTIDFYPSCEGGEMKEITLMITGYGDMNNLDDIDHALDEAMK